MPLEKSRVLSLSMDILPGPDSNRLIEMTINNNSTSSPPSPVIPPPALTTRIIPIICIMKRIDVILVRRSIINKMPPITSKSAIGNASSAGIPTEAKKPCTLVSVQT
jgi:hypothetical protein